MLAASWLMGADVPLGTSPAWPGPLKSMDCDLLVPGLASFSNHRDKTNKSELPHNLFGTMAIRRAGEDHGVTALRPLSSFSNSKDPAQDPGGCAGMGAAGMVGACCGLWFGPHFSQGFGDVTFDCGPSLSPSSP